MNSYSICCSLSDMYVDFIMDDVEDPPSKEELIALIKDFLHTFHVQYKGYDVELSTSEDPQYDIEVALVDDQGKMIDHTLYEGSLY